MEEQHTTKELDFEKDIKIKELTKENRLLFEQLHIVQEELEKYYNKINNYENTQKDLETKNSIVIMPTEAQEALIENIKLRALAEQQKIALQIERTNSLPVRLGEMLIKGVRSTGAFIALPVKLCKMWKALCETIPPSTLGGKHFPKVLDAYTSGGIEAVEKILNSHFLSPVMRADAYTALARKVMKTDHKQTAVFARMAWETDPRPYRLKWLIFRVHEANDPITAEALLNILPKEIKLNQSEELHLKRILKESKKQRILQANKIIDTPYIRSIQLNDIITNLKKEKQETITHINKLQENYQQNLNKINFNLENNKRTIKELHDTITNLKKEKQETITQINKLQENYQQNLNKINSNLENNKRTIKELHDTITNLKKEKEEAISQTKKLQEEHKKEIERINIQLIEEKKSKDLALQDALHSHEILESLQNKMKFEKEENDALTLRTAITMKNLLTHFESNTQILSQLMRIVMGAAEKNIYNKS